VRAATRQRAGAQRAPSLVSHDKLPMKSFVSTLHSRGEQAASAAGAQRDAAKRAPVLLLRLRRLRRGLQALHRAAARWNRRGGARFALFNRRYVPLNAASCA
jgi:hypothetical protein